MSSPSLPAVSTDRVRIGDLTAGPIATVGTGGVMTLANDTTTRWSWWVGAEDRWHRPVIEITTSDEHLAGAAGLRTTVKIPSGDFIGSATGARLDALGAASVLFELENASPVPVAVAFVVETSTMATIRTDGIDVGGVGALRLTRPAAGVVVAADAEALAAALAAGEQGTVDGGAQVSGAIALLIPLPHAAHAIAAVASLAPSGGNAVDDSVPSMPGSLDRSTAPRIESITRGWAAHLASSPGFSSGVARRDAVLRDNLADVLMGPTWGSDNAEEVAVLAEALGRVGRIDLGEPLAVLIADQRSNGALDAPDAVAATARLMRAIGATWSGGAAFDSGEHLLESAALAGHFLDKRRNRSAVAEHAGLVSFAYESVIGLAEDIGDHDLAAQFRKRCLELGVASPLEGQSADERVKALGAGAAFASQAAPNQPCAAASAAFVLRATGELVIDRADAVDIYPGYEARLAGNELDVESVPTRWGILSFSLRWHGRRPAILWEMTPWSTRSATRPFALTCSSIDPTWRTTDRVGEALLAEPAEADFEAAPEFVHEHLLSESSEGHSHGDWNAVPDFGDTSDIPDGGTFS